MKRHTENYGFVSPRCKLIIFSHAFLLDENESVYYIHVKQNEFSIFAFSEYFSLEILSCDDFLKFVCDDEKNDIIEETSRKLGKFLIRFLFVN